MKFIRRGKEYDSFEVWLHTYMHGRKYQAIQYKKIKDWYRDTGFKHISKSWKDQSKRKHQHYRDKE